MHEEDYVRFHSHAVSILSLTFKIHEQLLMLTLSLAFPFLVPTQHATLWRPFDLQLGTATSRRESETRQTRVLCLTSGPTLPHPPVIGCGP
ncbi:hypothetical protein E2C01_010772 [Portunus trituberculatus]|uniref:Uncharacterized protein n=1 Tax=Portunus trituberculatus TaxID=210409 RepID=A0A5B7D9I6_PORTR|nr:hypothetical protein [Portunus trituberculatus]